MMGQVYKNKKEVYLEKRGVTEDRLYSPILLRNRLHMIILFLPFPETLHNIVQFYSS